MNKKMAREIVESLPSLYPLMTTDEEEAIWTVLATNSNIENDGDCISRQQAIDALTAYIQNIDKVMGNDLLSIDDCRDCAESVLGVNELPPIHPDNQVHLCDSCLYTYPECPSVYTDMIFGNGTGNDNICACNKYLPSAQSEQRWIPLTERPPKESGEYFVTLKRVLLPISVLHPENNTYEYVTRIDRFNGEKFDMPTVVAWWSERLPKPWEGDVE